jgi:cytochrome c
VALVWAGALAVFALIRRDESATVAAEAAALTGGDPRHGLVLAKSLGCVACHEIPAYSGMRARVGPPLGGFAQRIYVAGVAENTPEHLMAFLRDPRSVAPRSAMPKLSVSEPQARDLAAYLYTLR